MEFGVVSVLMLEVHRTDSTPVIKMMLEEIQAISAAATVSLRFALRHLQMANWNRDLALSNIYRLFRSLAPSVSIYGSASCIFFSVPYRASEGDEEGDSRLFDGDASTTRMWSYVMCELTVVIPVPNRKSRGSPGAT